MRSGELQRCHAVLKRGRASRGYVRIQPVAKLKNLTPFKMVTNVPLAAKKSR